MKVLNLTKKGQAAIELAIFGSLLLSGFAVLLSYSQRNTEQQALQQQAFRMALRLAYQKNGSVSYSILKHHRGPSIFANFRQGDRESITSASNVLWSKGDIEDFAYYQVNEDLVPIPTHRESRGGRDARVPDEVWNVQSGVNTRYSGEENKQEDSANITTRRSANLRDTVTTTLKIRYENNVEDGDGDGTFTDVPDIVLTQGLCDNGRYAEACLGNRVRKERTWETSHY